MSESNGDDHLDHVEDWAPHDYTDSRKPGDWQTRYPDEARKWIRIEAGYLIILSLTSLATVFYILHQLSIATVHEPIKPVDIVPTGTRDGPPFVSCIGAFVAGMLGGCCFGLKWMYHSVAKSIWNADRRLWRFLTPLLSGVVALFTLLLVASGLLQIFDKDVVQRPAAVLAFGFLVGYFSDRALAKMAELADTLLGRTDKGG